ncbi:MAG: lamin tail domain-containing protein [Chitinophagaceae bacterium]
MKIIMIVLFLFTSIFSLAQATRNDVVMDEIMADPNPPAMLPNGLPEAEFIELKNVSQKTLNLIGWKISDATTTATINSNFMLQPDSFIIIGSVNAAAILSLYGRTVGVSNFPSLDNDGELIYLTSKEGRLIHAVEYNSSWYRNAVKRNGGWTLEMIDTKNTCSGSSNWTASSYVTGGTPGKKNSVDALNQDHMPPALLRSYATDSLNAIMVFDEPLDSLSAVITTNYFISDDIGAPLSAIAVSPLFNKVMLRLNRPLQRSKVYSVIAKKVIDCVGNEIGIINSARVGIASAVDSFDIVVNEILFNPKPDGVDYVEIYNRSERIIDLKDLYIANRSTSGALGSLKPLSLSSHLLFPGECLAITENANIVKRQYYAKNQEAFLELSSLPSYPDDGGAVVLLNATGKLIDEVSYSERWHFKLIDNNEGVALEKIDYDKPSQDYGNWHSASTSTGYGTPTYQNSQFKAGTVMDGAVTVTPAVFSPDNDGFDDFSTIMYQFPEPGYVCNITFFNVNGLPVRYLTRNAICGLTGYFRWDGLDEKNNKLPIGIYVMISEVFNLKGKTRRFKTPVVLARRLK